MIRSTTFQILLSALVIGMTLCSNEERVLVRDLMKLSEYEGQVVRPVSNINQSLKLNFSLALIDIMSFNPHSGVLEVKAWKTETWIDEKLKWDPKLYSYIIDTRIPMSRLWRPDIVLFNELTTTFTQHPSWNSVVSYNGVVLYIPPVIYKVRCTEASNETTEPEDEEPLRKKNKRRGGKAVSQWNCPFRFGSWTYDNSKVELHFANGQSEIDLSSMVKNPDVTVLSAKGKIEIKQYPCCVEKYPSVVYDLVLEHRGSKRKSRN